MASGTITEVAYRFLVDNIEAQKKNKQVKDSLKEINAVSLDDVGLSVDKLTKSFKGLLPVFSAAAIASFAYSAVQAADAIGDAADRAQLATGEFQRLNYVATQADVNFEELTRGLKQYRIGADEAEQGQGKFREGLARLNLTIADLRGLSIEEQLQKISDKFRDVYDPTIRAAIAQDLFGKSGQALIPLLLKGGDALKAIADEAERLGLVFDERAIAGADRFTKALDRLLLRAKVATGGTLGNLFADIFGTGDELADTEARLTRLKDLRDAMLTHPNPATVALLAPTLIAISELTERLETLKATATANGGYAYDEWQRRTMDRWRRELQTDLIQPFTPTVKKIQEEDEVIKQIRERQEQEAQARNERMQSAQAEINRENESEMAATFRNITASNNEELKRRSEDTERAHEQERDREKELQETLTSFRRDTVNAATTLLTAYGGKYKKFAQGILIIEKAHAIAKTIISTKAAAAAALEYYGPTPWGYAAAAAAIAFGVAQVAAIASTFIGGGSSAAGSPHNPVFVDTTAQTPGNDTLGTATPQGEQRALQIIIQGNVYSGRETVDFLLQQLSQRINEYDAVIINPSSRQARELQPEPTT
jgi:hypothetical protein